VPSLLKAIKVYSGVKGVEQDGSSRNLWCIEKWCSLCEGPGWEEFWGKQVETEVILNPLYYYSVLSLAFVFFIFFSFFGYNRVFFQFLSQFILSFLWPLLKNSACAALTAVSIVWFWFFFSPCGSLLALYSLSKDYFDSNLCRFFCLPCSIY